MDVGNDPFPREEVTGLAAFENLEPVSALNVMPEPPPPEPVAPPAPRTFNRPIGVAPVHAAYGGDDMDRADRTEILNLDKVEQITDEDDRVGGWEDEATSFFSPAAFRTPAAGAYGNGDHGSAAAPPAASLDMDWDEEEPPTRMRDDLPFLPPLGGSARSGTADWDDEAHPQPMERFDELATAGYAPVGADTPSTPPVGRPSPFPPAGANNGRAYLAPLAQVADRGGAPSPFSATDELPAAPSRPAWMLVAAGAGVAMALFLIGRLIFGGSSPASVTLTTAPADAQVFVDGKPASGSSSPYALNELAAGQHELVVQKEGFAEHRSTFTIESGESRALPLVQLSSKRSDTGFAVNSMPSGAEISIDGASIGKTTPAKVTGVAPGVHKLELKLADHSDFELQILVPDTGVLQLPIAELAESASPARARAEARAEAREARAEAREHRDREPRDSDVDDEPRPRRERAPKAEPVPVASRPEPAPAAPRGGGGAGGMLRLNSRPWSQVYVDGRLVGNTPQMGLPLSPGNHSIRLVNSQMGLTKTFSVSVKTGQMVTKVVNLVE